MLPSSARYHGQDPLTYASTLVLEVGSLVIVPLQNLEVLGIVVANEKEPSFATKKIVRLISPEPLPLQQIKLLSWIKSYYPAPLGAITTQFLPASVLGLPKKETVLKPMTHQVDSDLPQLTPDQKKVLKSIEAGTNSHNSWLIHGETGSGKTRIYLELARQTVEAGKSVLVLTPEIGLVTPLAKTFEQINAPLAIYHSNLPPAKRRNTWMDILQNSGSQIVIGPRSALFCPIKKLGLIVLDESHEPAYKQEQAPYYYAPRVAAKLAQLHGAKLISGTATPSVIEYYYAKLKNVPVLRMEKLAIETNHPKTKITTIDLRNRKNFSRHPYLSDSMLQSIQAALNNHEQSLIFINRRGSARLVVCQNCGWQATCPACNLPLTYHHDNHFLICHTCGHKQMAPINCPTCESTDIIFKSAGTKAIVESLKHLFPKAKIQRFDTDNPMSEKLEKHYDTIAKGEVDILVGTQILGKGLDLPRLSFIGVVNADGSLQFPDFTAEERTYQLLCQIIGRVGRGHKPGRAVIQSFQPDDSVVSHAISKNWEKFYESEIEQRRRFGFPPFYHLLRLSVSKGTQKSAQTAATNLASKLRQGGFKIEVTGPSPAFYEKQRGNYRWQLVIKAKDRSELLKVISVLPAGWTHDIDPINLL